MVPSRRRKWSNEEMAKAKQFATKKSRAKDSSIRENAILGLGILGTDDKPVIAAVRAAQKDQDDQVRSRAEIVLGHMLERTEGDVR